MTMISIGIQDFRKIREGGYLYVDKTEMISRVLSSGSKVHQITRPRRFGKSLNLSMLDAFFNLGYSRDNTWFDGLKVSDCRGCDAHRNAYPSSASTSRTLMPHPMMISYGNLE